MPGTPFQKGGDPRRYQGGPSVTPRKDPIRTRTKTGIAPKMRYMTDKETVSEEDYQRMLVEEGMRKEEEMIRQNAKMEARQAREAAKQAREVAKQNREEAKQAREVAKQAEQEARLKAKGPMARLKWQQDKVARDTRKESEGKRKQSQLHLRREKARKKRIAEEAARITKEAAQLAATQFASFQLAVSQQQTSFIVPMKNRASFQKLQTHSVPISGSLEERRQKTLPKAVAYSKAMTLLQYVRQMEEKSSSPRKLNRVKKRAVKSKRTTGSNRQFLNPNSIQKVSRRFFQKLSNKWSLTTSNQRSLWKVSTKTETCQLGKVTSRLGTYLPILGASRTQFKA